MRKERFGIDGLKEEIKNKTKIEKISLVKSYLEVFYKNYENLDEKVWQVYEKEFESGALTLLNEIEDDISIAYERDWNWFYNIDNIPNNDFVIATRDFIETKRKGEFESLYFFNLLFKQIDELKDCLNMPIDYIENLKALPLNEIQRHILFGMLLYWHGGYPVNNMNKKYNAVLKLIEREFLSMFPETVTPEKQFCKGDYEFKVQLKELENNMNNNIEVLVSNHKVFNIPFDFSNLPLYVRNELRRRFDQNTLKGTENFEGWGDDLKRFLFTIPEELRLPSLQKGIEYGKMRFEFYLEHECKDRLASPYAQSWERRLATAANLLNEVEPKKNNDITKVKNEDKNKLYDSFALTFFFMVPDNPSEGVAWLDAEGKWTYDIEKLVKKEKIEIPQHRQADNDTDFHLILERELKKNDLQNTPENKQFLTTLLIPEIDKLIILHKEVRTYGSTLDASLLQLAERFKVWLNKKNEPKEVSHREFIIAHNFKVKARIADAKTAAQWKTERGEKARQAYYTTLKQSDNYKPVTIKELQNIISLLNDFPQVQKMAINDLEALQSL
jgi:hypothetical protein